MRGGNPMWMTGLSVNRDGKAPDFLVLRRYVGTGYRERGFCDTLAGREA